jgi:hypothetical protein
MVGSKFPGRYPPSAYSKILLLCKFQVDKIRLFWRKQNWHFLLHPRIVRGQGKENCNLQVKNKEKKNAQPLHHCLTSLEYQTMFVSRCQGRQQLTVSMKLRGNRVDGTKKDTALVCSDYWSEDSTTVSRQTVLKPWHGWR